MNYGLSMVCLVFKRMIDMTCLTCLTEAEEKEKQHAEALKSSQADLVTSDFTSNALLLSARNTAWRKIKYGMTSFTRREM